MTDAEMKDVLVGIVLATAENIYISKCMFYNVPCLSESDKEKCIHEAVEALPEALEFYKKVFELGIEVDE
jgi:hypothetical protein